MTFAKFAAGAVVVVLVGVSRDASAAEKRTTPFKGATRVHRTAVTVGGATQDYHVTIVDLAEPTLRLAVSPQADRGKTTSAIAKKYKARLAINGSFYAGGFAPCGATRAAGTFWTNAYTGCPGTIAFGAAPNRTLLVSTGADTDGPLPAAASFGRDAISGKPLLMKNGASTAPWTNPSHINERHPRTALGYTAGGKKLVIVVADGRRAGAAGMRGADLVSVFNEFGVTDALNLDGGGSTTLFAGTGVLNRPSDGTERVVANAVMILPATPPPPKPKAPPGPAKPDAGAAADGGKEDDGGPAGDDAVDDEAAETPDDVPYEPPPGEMPNAGDEASMAEEEPAASAADGSGCSVSPRGGVTGAVAVGLAIAAATRRRRRNRDVSRSTPEACGPRSSRARKRL